MKKLLLAVSIIAYLFLFEQAQAQTVYAYNFENATANATTFSSNGYNFSISATSAGPVTVQTSFVGSGWNGTTYDNVFLDNNSGSQTYAPVSFTISVANTSAAKTIKLKSFYLYLAAYSGAQVANALVTITGKAGATTVFTTSYYGPYNNKSNVNNGYTLIDMSNFGGANNSNTNITSFTITTSELVNYVALDELSWAAGTATAPVVTTAAATSTTSSGGTLNAVINDGGTSTTPSFDYGTSPTLATSTNTTATPSTVAAGAGNTNVSATLSGLSIGTTYYYRAKGVNTNGTTTGSILSFVAAGPPVVTTTTPSSVTSTSSVLGGNVTSYGGANVIERGVVYSNTNTTPATSDYKIDNGNGTGTYSQTVPGFTPGTLYYERAYAINSVGTGYGAVASFTTTPNAPVITAPANASFTTSTTPTYTGTAQANSTVTVYVDNTSIGTTTATSGGSFSLVQPSALTQGSHTVFATATINGSAASANSSTNTFTVDNVKPTVVSINRNNAANTTATSIAYTVTFSEAVTGVDATDFTLPSTGTAASTGIAVTAVSATVYTVTLSGVSGNGTIGLNLKSSGTGIADVAGNAISGGFTGQVYTIDKTAPTVAISSSTSSPTNSTSIPITVTFSESVTGFVVGDVAVTNGRIFSFSGSGATYTFTITPATAGAITINVAANVAQDAAGNYNTAAPQFSITYGLPAVTGITLVNPSPLALSSVSYRVNFSTNITGLSVTNFGLTSSGSISGASVTSVTGSGSSYVVTVNTGTGTGTLRLDLTNTAGISSGVSNVPYTSGGIYTITRTISNPVLVIQGTGGTGSDVTAFVDQVQVTNTATSTVVSSAVTNGSFETYNTLANGGYGYSPTGATWAFNTTSGIATNGSAFSPPTPPNGNAVAFIQSNGDGNGSLQQTLNLTGGSYKVSFQAEQRVCCTTLDQGLNVFIGGVFFGSITPNTNNYSTFTSATFSVPATAPTVATTAVTAVGATTATLGGSITTDGGATITERGVVYIAGNGTPTTANTKVLITVNPSPAVASYSGVVTGLSSNTTYSVRAYAINSAGTSYGSVQTFTTLPVYYSKATGDLSVLSTYGTSADGTGTAPSDFNGSGSTTTYQLANRTVYALTADLAFGSNATLNIPTGATLDLAGRSLTLTNLAGTGTLTGSNTSALILNGTITGLTFAAGKEQLNSLNLGAGANVTLSSALNIASTGKLNLAANVAFNTGGTLTLRSDLSGTALISALGTGATITGNVTVERYVADKRAWRLITSAVNSSQSINAALQEGAGGSANNPNPGYGTFLIGSSASNGFDVTSSSGSLLTYSNATGVYSSVANTNAITLSSNPGYFLFSIGDRGIDPATLATAHTATTLRSTGTVRTGTQTSTVNAAGFTLIGNPYAAPVDFAQVTKSATVLDRFYAWDINLNTLGGYVLVTNNGGTYTSVPSSPSGLRNILASGSAILVQTDGTNAGSLTFNESSKATGAGSGSFSNFLATASNQHNFTVNLTGTNGKLIDGVLASFAQGYSNNVDNNDAPKLKNFYENISLDRAGKLLTLEKRSDITAKDSIFIQLSGMKATTYQLQIDPSGFNETDMTAYLDDAYLHTHTRIDLTNISNITFIASADVASYQSRFSISFTPPVNNQATVKTSHAGASVIAYPNPATQKQVSLWFDGLPVGNYNITVMDSFGHIMQRNSFNYNGTAGNKALTTDYATGVYTVNIQSVGYSQSIKVIVQ